jgi:hypothetical protein
MMLAVVGAIAILTTTMLMVLVVQDLRRSWRVRRRFAHGRAGEDKAVWLLRRAGYKVLDRQIHRKGTVICDGKAVEFDVFADFWVEKDGRELPADSKTGECGSPTDRNTRRQLLEYALLFRVSAVLLVAPDRGEIIEVRFPDLSGPAG